MEVSDAGSFVAVKTLKEVLSSGGVLRTDGGNLCQETIMDAAADVPEAKDTTKDYQVRTHELWVVLSVLSLLCFSPEILCAIHRV